AAQLGKQLHFGTGAWQVVGIMSAGQSATNSEIFADMNQLSSDYHRSEELSSCLIRATDAVAADALVKDLDNDQRLNVDALLERQYYDKQTVSALPIASLGILVSLIMAVGSAFAAMNDEHHVRCRGTSRQGNRHAPGAGLLATEYHAELSDRVSAAGNL